MTPAEQAYTRGYSAGYTKGREEGRAESDYLIRKLKEQLIKALEERTKPSPSSRPAAHPIS